MSWKIRRRYTCVGVFACTNYDNVMPECIVNSCDLLNKLRNTEDKMFCCTKTSQNVDLLQITFLVFYTDDKCRRI